MTPRRRVWHLITGEYPPQPGGVSDYTAQLAAGLVEAGDEVHVWCPAGGGSTPGIVVHPELGRFRPRDWARLGRALNRLGPRRRLLVQWVPHGFGWRSLNLPFCLWLWLRSILYREQIEIMVHEPYLEWAGSWTQRLAAVGHRVMTAVLLRSAVRVWVSTPSWVPLWKPYTFGKKIAFGWLPVPANVPVLADPAGVQAVRDRLARGGLLLGHFGTYGRLVADLLGPALPRLLRGVADLSVVLLGRGSEEYRKRLLQEYPEFAERVIATGSLMSADLSRHLQACDLMLQPYADGVSSRRTSVMAALAHGRPVVTTAGRYTEALWADSGAVALSPTGDADAVAATARRLLASAEDRALLGSRAAALYRDTFALRHTLRALRGEG